jgi:intracellular multiplication protein IcmL
LDDDRALRADAGKALSRVIHAVAAVAGCNDTNQPHHSNEAVANYAVTAVTSALTYSFDRYREQFQEAQDYFTQPQGWNSFVEAVDNSDILDLVQERRFNSTAVAQNALIVRQGVNAEGVYEWVLQMPVRVTYQSASEVTGQNIMVTIYLKRLQTYQTPAAMAIDRFVAGPGRN